MYRGKLITKLCQDRVRNSKSIDFHIGIRTKFKSDRPGPNYDGQTDVQKDRYLSKQMSSKFSQSMTSFL